MKRVTMIGGIAAGDTVETACSKIVYPFLDKNGYGSVEYHVRRVRLGRMVWYVGTISKDEPVHPFQLLQH